MNFLKHQDSKINNFLFSFYCIVASFGTYFCMYAFRKPFAVGTYEGLEIWGIDYKILLVVSQLVGYTLSKFIGIKVVSELSRAKRARTILFFIGISWLSLFLFGLIPYPWNFIMLFFNGLPLGMIWGIVFSFLEGRRVTEFLAAGLSASFIVSSGVVKSVGKFFMETVEIPEFWMPFVTGAVFIPLLLLFTGMLHLIPPPSATDENVRTQRVPMNASERRKFFAMFAPGIIGLILAYIIITVFRDFRDNFAADMWQELGYGDSAKIFTLTEIPVAFGVLIILGLTALIPKNKIAFKIDQFIVMFGIAIIFLSTVGFSLSVISPMLWMIATGFGLYLAYVPYNSVLFERLIALFNYKSNAGYLIYLADAFGYLGSVLVLLLKNFGLKQMQWSSFFINFGYITSISCIVFLVFSYFYFQRKAKNL